MFKANGDIRISGRVVLVHFKNRVDVIDRGQLTHVSLSGNQLVWEFMSGQSGRLEAPFVDAKLAAIDQLYTEIVTGYRDVVYTEAEDGTWSLVSETNKRNMHPANRTTQKAIEE